MRPDLPELLELLNRSGIRVAALSTNGSLLTEALLRQFEESDAAAIFHLQKDVDVRAVQASGRNVVFAHGVNEFQAQHLGVEIDGGSCVLAAKCRMMQSFTQHEDLPVVEFHKQPAQPPAQMSA